MLDVRAMQMDRSFSLIASSRSRHPIAFVSQFPSFFSSFSLSSSDWLSLLRTAVSTSNLYLGKCIHARIIRSQPTSNLFLTNNLISMYSRCGSLSSARNLFDKTLHRDLVTWNSILAAFAQSADHVTEGFYTFRLLRQNTVWVSKLTLAPLLKLCFNYGHLWPSQSVHGYAVKIGLAWDMFVSGALVNTYSKFGRIKEARDLFDGILEKDRVLWNVMLNAYIEGGFKQEALQFLSDFRQSGFCPDSTSVQSVLAATDQLLLHEESSNLLSWNTKLSQLNQTGKHWNSIQLFREMMITSNVEYDSVTLVIALAAVTSINQLEIGLQIHGLALKSGFSLSISVGNSLINMYSKEGFINSAKNVFLDMRETDIISWNTIISGCAQRGLEKESINLFIALLRRGFRPDNFTLASVLRACSSYTGHLYLGGQIHVHAVKTDTVGDRFVLTSLVDVYSKGGKLEKAEFLFLNNNQFDLATCNTLMSGFITSNNSAKALKLFTTIHKSGERADQMTLATAAKACASLFWLKNGKQIHAYAIRSRFNKDLCVGNAILDMYIKCGDMVNARRAFDEIPDPDDVAWTTMISGCVGNRDEDWALSIYHKMRMSGVKPDEYTFATLIKACSSMTALEQGRQIHADVIKLDCGSDIFVGTSLIDMYSKCGNIEEAYCLFRKMKVKSSIALWNAMLVGLAQHGNGKDAINLFKLMSSSRSIKPDKVTFIGVLSACSHSGLISDAYTYFHSMQEDYCIKPEIEHYSCLVDALGRAGRVQEAKNLITSMPFVASASMCRALLGACKVQGDTMTGKWVAEQLLAIEPSDSSAYVLLSNIYASANQWEDVNNTRRTMMQKCVKKDLGFSWISVNNKVHLFVADDKSHPESELIYDRLHELMKGIREKGYVPDRDFVLLNLEEEEKEESLFYHSEKLAIAYAIMKLAPAATIRVIKNLRVCGDCHNAIKYISMAFQREIVLRDANRFHHFKDGSCSCGDYW